MLERCIWAEDGMMMVVGFVNCWYWRKGRTRFEWDCSVVEAEAMVNRDVRIHDSEMGSGLMENMGDGLFGLMVRMKLMNRNALR